MPTQALLDRIHEAEVDIVSCQETIDHARAMFRFDNVINEILDNQQSQLDRQKRDLQELKELAGITE